MRYAVHCKWRAGAAWTGRDALMAVTQERIRPKVRYEWTDAFPEFRPLCDLIGGRSGTQYTT